MKSLKYIEYVTKSSFTTYPLKALNIEKKYKTLKSAQKKPINF